MIQSSTKDESNLPNWMKQSQESFDWGIIIVIAFCLISAWPFISQTTLPDNNDNIHHAFRTAENATAIREGRFYPRWSAYTHEGIGSPISHFSPPAATHFAAVIEILLTGNTIMALRIVYILASVIAGLMVYLIVRKHSSIPAAMISALLYVYSPYVGFTLPHVLGNLPEVVSLALLPLLIWSVNRSLDHSHLIDLLVVAIVTASIILTAPRHLIAGVIYCMILIPVMAGTLNKSHLIRLTITMAGGIGLAAFYWLPALIEYDHVTWITPTLYLPQYTLSLQGLFASTTSLDPNALHHYPQFNLGPLLMILSLLNIVMAAIFRRTFHQLFLVTGLAFLAYGVLIAPDAIWLLGPGVLGLSIGSTGIMDWKTNHIFQKVLFVALLGLILWRGVPFKLASLPYNPILAIAPVDQLDYERSHTGIAVLPLGDPIPFTSNRERWEQIGPIEINADGHLDRIAANATSEAQLTLLLQNTHEARYQIFTNAQRSIIYKQSYFPGWIATLSDGQRIPFYQDPSSGLTRIDLPANVNDIMHISFSWTRLRVLAWVISIVSGGVILGGIWFNPTKSDWIERQYSSANRFELVATIISLTIIMVLIIPPVREAILDVPASTNRLRDVIFTYSRTNTELQLLGYKIDESTLPDQVQIQLYWDILAATDHLYEVQISLRSDSTNQVWAESQRREPGFYATNHWKPDFYMEDIYSFALPQTMPTGVYYVDVQVFRCNPSCDESVLFAATASIPRQAKLTLPASLVLE